MHLTITVSVSDKIFFKRSALSLYKILDAQSIERTFALKCLRYQLSFESTGNIKTFSLQAMHKVFKLLLR